MQKNALFSVIAAALLLIVLMADHAVPRLQPPPLRIIPIERLPRTIGLWQCVADQPIDKKVTDILPHARMLARIYRAPSGEEAQLLLESDPVATEYHSPTVCMPGQGWNVANTSLTRVGAAAGGGGPVATEMEMEGGGQRLAMLYWYSSDIQLDKWETLKAKLLAGRAPTRLFVRILVPAVADDESAMGTAHGFGQALLPVVAALERGS